MKKTIKDEQEIKEYLYNAITAKIEALSGLKFWYIRKYKQGTSKRLGCPLSEGTITNFKYSTKRIAKISSVIKACEWLGIEHALVGFGGIELIIDEQETENNG